MFDSKATICQMVIIIRFYNLLLTFTNKIHVNKTVKNKHLNYFDNLVDGITIDRTKT